MTIFKIAVTWDVYATMEVEANSLKEAKLKARDEEPLPTEIEYVDDSIRINHEMTDYFNKEGG